MSKYEDIIHLNRPLSKKKKMSLIQRAAQFSPFAALTGHNEAIKETARLTNERIELDEQEIILLNEKLQYLKEHLPYTIKITYFNSFNNIKANLNSYKSRPKVQKIIIVFYTIVKSK